MVRQCDPFSVGFNIFFLQMDRLITYSANINESCWYTCGSPRITRSTLLTSTIVVSITVVKPLLNNIKMRVTSSLRELGQTNLYFCSW